MLGWKGGPKFLSSRGAENLVDLWARSSKWTMLTMKIYGLKEPASDRLLALDGTRYYLGPISFLVVFFD